MYLRTLSLRDVRNHAATDLALDEGLTVLVGDNGQGKTTVLEAISVLARLRSFRGVPPEALVARGTEQAVIRAEVAVARRELLIEVLIPRAGRVRAQINRRPVKRLAELAELVAVTVFAPDDLALVKEGPAVRRDLLDELVAQRSPADAELRPRLDKILRQRNTLLRQAGPRPGTDLLVTLDVWDDKLTEVGTALARCRAEVVAELTPLLSSRYEAVAGELPGGRLDVGYRPSWLATGLADALAASRADDLKRGVSTTGPHRDEVELTLAGLPARTHASQGEQRTLALALRLAGHELVARARPAPPLVLLDDVLSELDDQRARALMSSLPAGQAVLSTTGRLPPGADRLRLVRVRAGTIEADD